MAFNQRRISILASIILTLGASQSFAGFIELFSPMGSVKQAQQIRARFSTDMVTMGDPRSYKDPFHIACNSSNPAFTKTIPEKTFRWADSRNWVLDYDKPLPSGVRCEFFLKSDLKDLAGVPVDVPPVYVLTTGGPALLGLAPQVKSIEPDQYFIAQTDGDIDFKSVEQNAYFEVSGIADKVRIKIITGKERDTVLKGGIPTNYNWSSWSQYVAHDEKRPPSQIKELDNFIVIAAKRRFPENAQVALHWPQGILSKTGTPVEEAQVFNFSVIPNFRALFTCERAAPERACNPILDMRLVFNRRVTIKSLTETKLVAPNGQVWRPQEFKRDATDRKFNDEWTEELTFKAPFPDSTKFQVVLSKVIKDELGRPLENLNKFPLEVGTDEYTPLIKFPGAFGILELNADPALPVSVRNIEKGLGFNQVSFEGRTLNVANTKDLSSIINWYDRLMRRYQWDYGDVRNSPLLSSHEGSSITLPKAHSEREFELVGIPFKKPGFYIVEISSPKLGAILTQSKQPMYVGAGALVTNMAVHLKKGRESSLVWVTHLSNATSVADAKITIVSKAGRAIAQGTTDKTGIVRFGKLDYPCVLRDDDQPGHAEECEVFAFAQKGEDISFVSSDWNKGIEQYRFNLYHNYMSENWGPVVLHTILDRMVAQKGDAVNMKHVLRDHTGYGFKKMASHRLPKKVLVRHNGSNKTYTIPFTYDPETGAATGKFDIPKDATLGRYSIYLSNSNKAANPNPGEDAEADMFDWSAQETGHFLVSEYRLPLMDATVKIQGSPLIRPSEVKVDLSANYLAGGPASDLKVKLRAQLEDSEFIPDIPGKEDYIFFSQPVTAGIRDFQESYHSEEQLHKVQDLVLKKDGGLLAKITEIPSSRRIRDLRVEMDYTDPNGEVKTKSSRIPIFPGENIIGLRSESWFGTPGKTSISGVIVDTKGKLKGNQTYTIEAFKSNYITHRKRLVGGFYSYDSKYELKSLGKVCDGKTDKSGRFKCEPKSVPPGQITLQAKTVDNKNNATYSNTNVSVYSEGSDFWWTPSDSDRIDLIPEQIQYEPGDKAKFVVQSPFPKSTVLLTIEREGILDVISTEITRDKPVIEVPIKGNYAPNIFISAVVLRGRVGDTKPTALLDLAKPAMKVGMSEIRVGWKAHELLVNVSSDKKKYHTREKAQIEVQVKSPTGAPLPANAEVTIAAVDESLLRLKDNSSWKILKAMMGQRSLEVSTASGQNQVIGRRHFGSKAKPAGGGGGQMGTDARELFDAILLWQPKVKLDAAGKAKITVPLNDSITSFRIAAVATAADGYFGDGSVSIPSTKDLIIYSGFAPLVREGDQVSNVLTLRNTTEKTMKVALEINTGGVTAPITIPQVEMKPSESKTLDFPFKVPMDKKEIAFTIKAKDSISGAADTMIAKVKVEMAIPPRVLQATLFQLDKNHSIPIKQPIDAIPGRGGLNISARPSLVSGLAGVRSYMSDYPYSCLEQQTSKYISLDNVDAMKGTISALPAYMDGYGLLKFFPISRCGDAQLTSYVVNILQENQYEIPSDTKTKIAQGLESYVLGRYSCDNWWSTYADKKYDSQQKVLAMETLSRLGSFKSEMLSTIQITPNLWGNKSASAWYLLLKREKEIPNRDVLIKQADNILRSRVNFQGSLMNLQNVPDYLSEWMLFTSPDQEVMAILGIALDEPSWNQDIGRMARGAVARMRLGRWDTTLSNAWGVTYFRKFSTKFEKEAVSGETSVVANEVKASFVWKNSPLGEKKIVNWPKDSDKKDTRVQFTQVGSGKPWIHFETTSAIPLKAPFDLGYKIRKKITPVTQAKTGTWSVGDVANIELTVTANADQPWVVIRDAVPAGAAHLGTGLEGTSAILDKAPQNSDHTQEVSNWPSEYDEKSKSNFTSYAAYLPKGTYRVNYRIRLNSAGVFNLPPSRIEAMYSPETFGESPNETWTVSR